MDVHVGGIQVLERCWKIWLGPNNLVWIKYEEHATGENKWGWVARSLLWRILELMSIAVSHYVLMLIMQHVEAQVRVSRHVHGFVSQV